MILDGVTHHYLPKYYDRLTSKNSGVRSDDQFYFFVDLVVELVDTTGLSPVAYCGYSGSNPDEVTTLRTGYF